MTDKQQMFIAEYLKDFNATQAAIRAGYSTETAYSIGNENLSKPEIKKAIDDHKKAMLRDADAVVYANVKYWISVRDDDEASPQARLKASEYLGKYGAMFTDTNVIKTIDDEGREKGFTFVAPPEVKGGN